MDYKKMYFFLFNAVTEALGILQESKIVSDEVVNAEKILKFAQIKTEEMYINEQ